MSEAIAERLREALASRTDVRLAILFGGSAARWRSRALVDLENDRPWFERMRDAHLDRLAADRER